MKFTAGIAVGLFVALLVFPLISSDNIYNQIEKYNYVLSLVIKEYFEDSDVSKLTEGAIRGMLQELDPHSTYITPKDMKHVNEDMGGSFEGIGIQFMMLNDTLLIDAVIADGPSERVGMQARDRIYAVNGSSIVGLSQDSIPKLLRGPKGTVVSLSVYRPATKERLEFSVTRDKIPLYSIDVYFVVEGTDIGYIRMNRFAQTTHEELVNAGKLLRAEGMKRLILDLRGNGGGILEQAHAVCDEFLRGDTIVYTHGRHSDQDQIFTARPGGSMEDIPLIVLVDGSSASASEITAGAIQDLDRGLVVGVTSFGKGLVQRQYPIYSDGSSVRITIARFYSASGRCIQRPFKDKENWKLMTDRLEVEEGANLEHVLDKIKKEDTKKSKDTTKKKDKNAKIINMDSIEIFYTRAGRPVLGGGGITPDYVIKYDTSKLQPLTISLYYSGIFLAFNDQILKEYKDKYSNDFSKFNKEFKMTDKMEKDLRKLAESKDIVWNDEEFKKDKDYIANRWVKYFLARSIWNTNKATQIMIPIDRQLNKALELFPLAEKIQASGKKK
jgi:carboxyl-terminal processing protease